MQQHPLPQNISTYKFRLIGDMTIKQFLISTAGVGVAILFFTSNLFGPIKWVLIITSVFLGIGIAFLTIEERPMEQWVLAYIRAIYSPTQFIWRKQPTTPAFFNYTQKSSRDYIPSQQEATAAIQRKQAGLTSFIQTINENPLDSNLNQQETSQLQTINQLFSSSTSSTPPPTPSPPPPQPTPPPPSPTISQPNTAAATPPTPAITPPPKLTPTPKPSPPPKPAPKTPAPSGVVPATSVKIESQAKPKPTSSPIKGEINLNQTQSKPQPTPKTTPPPAKKAPATPTPAATDTNLPFPTIPKSPNTTVGMVIDAKGAIIENAIIEIRDQQGTPVRATKTNKLGQFFSSTPLKNGHYQIEVEKEGFRFDILDLELKGQIINPIKIQAKQT